MNKPKVGDRVVAWDNERPHRRVEGVLIDILLSIYFPYRLSADGHFNESFEHCELIKPTMITLENAEPGQLFSYKDSMGLMTFRRFFQRVGEGEWAAYAMSGTSDDKDSACLDKVYSWYTAEELKRWQSCTPEDTVTLPNGKTYKTNDLEELAVVLREVK